MANRNWNRLQALEKEVKHLHADVSIGSSGAPTITKALGIASIARDSAGVYTVTLDDKFMRLMDFRVTQLVASAEDLKFQLVAESVSSAKTVQFRCIAVGTETDPSSGSRLLIKLELKNSSI